MVNRNVNIKDGEVFVDDELVGSVMDIEPEKPSMYESFVSDQPIIDEEGNDTGKVYKAYYIWNGVGYACVQPGSNEVVTFSE